MADPEPPDHPEPLSRLVSIAVAIVLRCPDALAAGPRRERLEALHDLYLLGLLGIFEFGLWTTAFITYGVPVFVAAPAGLLVALMIVEIDVRMTASDTAPRGILRAGPRGRGFWGFLASRILISLILAQVTASALDMTIFRGEALQVMDAKLDAANAPVRAAYNQRLAELRAETVTPSESEVADLTRQRDQALAGRFHAGDDMLAAENASLAADLEREQQDGGIGGRRPGHGVLAIDAEEQRNLATARARNLAARKSELGADADDLSPQINAAKIQLASALQRFNAEARQLRAERDGQLLRPTTGPLTVALGLMALQADPHDGPAVWAVSIMASSAIMALELAFFLVRSVFRSASVHDAYVNVDTQRRVVTLAHDLEHHVRQQRRRPPLRVVEDDGGPDGHDEDAA